MYIFLPVGGLPISNHFYAFCSANDHLVKIYFLPASSTLPNNRFLYLISGTGWALLAATTHSCKKVNSSFNVTGIY